MAASVLAAGIALSGCSGQPGAAAVVDGDTISEQALAQSGRALQPFLSNRLSPRSMLSSMIQADVFLPIAAEHGLAASPDEARDYLDNIAQQADVTAPDTYPEGTLDVARMLMITQKMRTSDKAQVVQQEVADEVATLQVSISPRYGSWDPQGESGSLVQPPSPDWLIQPDDGTGGTGTGGTGSGTGADESTD